ncbi:MAG: hypothetical protein EOP84_00705 [Verrucomicrobiaceae bacterium]|nr:MAG: hypothetical protein EOP84_00705 [Verrucomicrobiaceae bacterium]
MLEEQLIRELRQRLVAETEAASQEITAPEHLLADAALAEVMLGDLEEAGTLSEHHLCPHEDRSDRRRCRVIGYSLPDDAIRLELITSRFVEGKDTTYLPSDDLSKLSGHAARFFEYVAKGDLERFKDNPAALEAAEHIRSQLSRIEEVRVHILTNASVKNPDIDPLTIAGRHVEFSVWGIDRLHRASGEQVTRDRIEIDFSKIAGGPIAALEMKPPQSEYQTFLLVMPGIVLSKLYDDFGATLFEFNVRSFLQARGQVNKGIRDTLRTEPERFLAYNNGLTATADVIDVGTLHGETVVHGLKGLQIVNGAQTTASIHRAHKIDKIDISKVAVAMKLTRVDPAKLTAFVPLISKFANTQNPVQLADLSANNEFHIAVERLSGQEWAPGEETRWFYERARGAYEVARMRQGTTPTRRATFDEQNPKSKRFDKTDLAKAWMTWWGKPHVVSKGAQKNFAAFMAELKDRYASEWVPEEAYFHHSAALVMIYKAAKTAVRKAEIPSYGANVVTYLAAKLQADHAERVDLGKIWDAQCLSPEFLAMLVSNASLVHAEIVEGAGSRNVTEFAKKEECWERVKAMPLPKPKQAPLELGGISKKKSTERPLDTSASADAEIIEQVTRYGGGDWARIFAWAAESRAVAEIDRKVTHTVMGYAVNGWTKEPSEKQARFALRVLDAAKKAGVV